MNAGGVPNTCKSNEVNEMKFSDGFQDTSFDLHVLGTPTAFILSQDQTLMLKCLYPDSKFSLANF